MTKTELKNKIKTLAKEITEMKKLRKEMPYGFVPGLSSKRYDARHYHVAASLLRGRNLEVIEKPSDDNPLNMTFVQNIMKDVTISMEKLRIAKMESNCENVCDCQG